MPKRFKDHSVSLRSTKLQKFRYSCIEFCTFRSPPLLTHGQPSALKHSKSTFLLTGHGPSGQCFANAGPACLSRRERCRPRADDNCLDRCPLWGFRGCILILHEFSHFRLSYPQVYPLPPLRRLAIASSAFVVTDIINQL